MKNILGYIREYWVKDVVLKHLAAILLLAAGLTYLNYRDYFSGASITFEDTYIKSVQSDSLLQIFRYFQLYFVAFGGSYLLLLLLSPANTAFRNGQLWLMIFFVSLCFSLRAWSLQGHYLPLPEVPDAYRNLMRKCSVNITGFLTLFLPGLLYWLIFDRERCRLYGFQYKGVALKPYFLLIALMFPFICWAATTADFLNTYPTGNRLFYTDVPYKRLWILLYELSYGCDFVYTEFFFRGLLILAFTRWVGPHCILPMCTFYLTIHFDKPFAEAVSSFFGGALLGILAYRTKSIYGGIIVHLGIAWMMDLAATWVPELMKTTAP